MGKMLGQPLEAKLIKWKLRLLWKNKVKNTFYLDHYGKKWFVVEFTDEADPKNLKANRLKISHLER